MDMLASWSPLYSVGHDLLDRQHQQLLSLCQQAQLCVADDSEEGNEAFHFLLHELSVYARVHFRSEEEILAARGYDRLDEQMREHTEYIERLTEFLLLAANGMLDKIGVETFLSSWWINHILVSDMQYAALMRGERQDDQRS